MAAKPRHARVEDVHELALRMPHAEVEYGPRGNPISQVGGKSFVFFRTPRPDAVVDPLTGARFTDELPTRIVHAQCDPVPTSVPVHRRGGEHGRLRV